MDKIARTLIKYKKSILIIFIGILAVSAFFATKVNVNFDLSSYLPKKAPSTIAIEIMGKEFDNKMPNLEVGLPNKSLTEAIQSKEELEELPFVYEVLWLDDQVDLAVPIEMLDEDIVSGFYKDNIALYRLTVDEDENSETILRTIREQFGEDTLLRGSVVETASMQRGITKEIGTIVAFILPVALIILLLSTKSWFEPILFLATIFVGVVINMGTNALLPNVSFLTQAVASVLQLAVSMDYAVFLLHNFNKYKGEGYDLENSVRLATAKSLVPILSSALTTVFGFLTLIFMRFRIGADMGIVLAKGVLFSLFSVFVLMPVLILYTHKLIDKTKHRSFLPSFKKLSKRIVKFGSIILIIAALLIVPSYLAQRSNKFLYGNKSAASHDSKEYLDKIQLEETFGTSTQMVVLVPRNHWGQETQLIDDLENIEEIISIIGYASQVGTSIPPEMLPESIVSQLLSENYSRLILVGKIPEETDDTFRITNEIKEAVSKNYPEQDTHLAGGNFVLSDMKETINKDLIIVNGLAILTIALVIMIAFKSLALPILLVLTIELSIWINLAVPYITSTPLNFIGYLIISTVQLGATVDYGILMAQHYLDHRQTLSKIPSAQKSIQEVVGSIAPPALILASAGFALSALSSINVVSELGTVLGRGALLSLLMVTLLLPNLLMFFDKFIQKTTKKTKNVT